MSALDVSEVALDRARAAARRAGVDVDVDVEWIHAGLLEASLGDRVFDLVSVQYPALLRTPSNTAEHALLASAAPGGQLLVVHHGRSQPWPRRSEPRARRRRTRRVWSHARRPDQGGPLHQRAPEAPRARLGRPRPAALPSLLRGVGDGRVAGSPRILRRSGLISVLRAPATPSEPAAVSDYAENDSFGSPPSDTDRSRTGGSGADASSGTSRGMFGAIHSPCFSKPATDVWAWMTVKGVASSSIGSWTEIMKAFRVGVDRVGELA